MQKQTKLKVIILSIAMVSGLLTVGHAQSDGFFRGSMESYENRDAGINSNDGTGITNSGIGENASLGSGLLILAAAGAGYAFTKRRRNYRRGATLLLVLAMTLTFTNCKKKVETISNEATNGVKITLNVDGGSKVIVNPTGHTNPNYATVTFEAGDIIYVGNNGHYCGYLQHNGTYFTGSINETNLSTSDYLHFYFMGNKGELSQPSSVNITDQTLKYPVISYAHSKQLYNGAGSYTAKLENYCAIVKFTTTDIYPEITITGMNNTVSVDFGANNAADGTGIGHNPYAPSKTGEGDIKLHKVSNTERWAILLPQGEVTTATASAPNYVSESAFTVPEITTNMYNSVGVIVSLSKLPYIDANFTVANGRTVKFAAGNLQYIGSDDTPYWQFADNQYDYLGTTTGQNSAAENVDRDLFGWGTSGYNNKYPYMTSTTNSNYGNGRNNISGTDYDWGVYNKQSNQNRIEGGGDHAWRVLTKDEWVYLFKNRTTGVTVNNTSNASYTEATINTDGTSVNGIILFPDNYAGGTPSGVTWGTINGTSSWGTKCTTAGWSSLEAAGCVFLPAAGRRNGVTVSYTVSHGYYWSGTYYDSNSAYNVYFLGGDVRPQYYSNRKFGSSVRLVF